VLKKLIPGDRPIIEFRKMRKDMAALKDKVNP